MVVPRIFPLGGFIFWGLAVYIVCWSRGGGHARSIHLIDVVALRVPILFGREHQPRKSSSLLVFLISLPY